MKVVRITAIWCMSCLVMRRRYDQLFQQLGIEEIIDLDFDEDDLSTYGDVSILPLVIIYRDDQEILRLAGEHSKKELSKLLQQLQ